MARLLQDAHSCARYLYNTFLATLRGKPETHSGLELWGSPAFLTRTVEALDLLERAELLSLVSPHLHGINESSSSGVSIVLGRPVFFVGEPTWNAGGTWYAGAIVHDAHHAFLYHAAARAAGRRRIKRDCWAGTDGERKCLRVQLEALGRLGADAETMDYVRSLIPNPTYQGQGRLIDSARRDW
jgi:hypothetical protein